MKELNESVLQKRMQIVEQIFLNLQVRGATVWIPQREKGLAFAPTNIALCKYWGKRDEDLNLPLTSSLSVALPDYGAMTTLKVIDADADQINLNNKRIATDTIFYRNTVQFLNLFRPQQQWHLQIDISMNIPVAAGLASSACGFAALLLALNDLFDWKLAKRELSILARFGSGSAARSLWNGFVEWHAGVQADGMDCFAEQLDFEWPALKMGILHVSDETKAISSREAMQRTVNTGALYQAWPKKVAQDMVMLRQALQIKNFALLGGTAESNALSMHATMLSSWPPICYSLPATIQHMQTVWQLRADGLQVYFTQDAGPNLKLLFLENDEVQIKAAFPSIEIAKLFEN